MTLRAPSARQPESPLVGNIKMNVTGLDASPGEGDAVLAASRFLHGEPFLRAVSPAEGEGADVLFTKVSRAVELAIAHVQAVVVALEFVASENALLQQHLRGQG